MKTCPSFSRDRLYADWVYGGFLAGLLLIGLLPILAHDWALPMLFVFLQLPSYMLHQYEEHDSDRFRKFVNENLGGGAELLSKFAVFLINIPGVWGVNLVSIFLAFYVDIGFGLIGVYLTLINALAHMGQGIALRCYNPGLVTSIVLFLPVSGFALWAISPLTTYGFHAIGIFSAIAIHLAIIIHVITKKRRLTRS